MNERAHIIDIDKMVLDGVAHLRPAEMRRLIEREVSRALGVERSVLHDIGVTERNVAEAVASSVVNATPTLH